MTLLEDRHILSPFTNKAAMMESEVVTSSTNGRTPVARGLWSEGEHERFLYAMKMFPRGPWRAIAECVGSRSSKQVQTHAQKYQQKVHRRLRGLRKQKKKPVRPEHRVDQFTPGYIVRAPSSESMNSSPRSPLSLQQVMSNAEMALCEEDVQSIGMLLQLLEPLPFTPVPCDEYFAADQPHMEELRQSLALFLPQ
jgi:SHAQKYF class myb-like DNA-binding protein